ncbi:hydroxyacylglutathione hydrolase [Stenotrophobium rhamnosiphilum]|nr:hydroxyacylglutathione hydrolase [Stenotrophobium rhamnosiphilum]
MSTILMMLDVHAIPAFTDNYLWLLSRGADAVIVDPGDAAPVLQVLSERGLKLTAILITHWHPDHIGGINKLLELGPVPVYGPRAEFSKIPQLTHQLDDGDRVTVLDQTFEVMAVPGHTLGHIAYFADQQLFCGDTLFSAGCGRLFEGTPEQMHASLSRYAALPAATQVYCTHEYTMSNLAFAVAVEPQNPDLLDRLKTVRALRAQNLPSLPTTLAIERASNPFIRVDVPDVIAAAQHQSGQTLQNPSQVFAILRRWKDGFKTPVGF